MKTALTVERPVSAKVSIPTDVSLEFDAFARQMAAHSDIVWGEHCSECAVPSCYSACSFYSPRADLTCRRFLNGIEIIDHSGRANLHRIRFRKWGKLEGGGPVALHSTAAIQWSVTAEAAVSRFVRMLPLPFRLRRHLAWRWNGWRRTAANHKFGSEPQAFVVESWSADGRSHSFTVTFLEADSRRMYQEGFDIGPSYSRLTIPLERIADHIDLDAPYLVQVEPSGDASGCEIVLGCCDFVATPAETEVRKPLDAASTKKHAKVVVWDLDNTLWDGILAEDGVEGVVPRSAAVSALAELDSRGILNSIASKNDEQEALAALRKFGLKKYFLHPQIGWRPKSVSIGRISKLLDLSVDSFIFVDDQPFERGEVAEAHPKITTIADTDVVGLAGHPLCDVPATTESRRRRAMYQAEALRSVAFQSSGAEYIGFLRSCRINLRVSRLNPSNVERVYELSQRTNQLNFFGTKYDRDDVKELLRGGNGLESFVMACSDRFGEYGIIGFAVVDFETSLVVDFFMSCRVQRKLVENAFFEMIAKGVRLRGRDSLSVRFRGTERNGASLDMLAGLGFSYHEESPGVGVWTRGLTEKFELSDVVSILDLTEKSGHLKIAGSVA
jgi:FkbH-like protein